ncbi:Tyrocidine synthase III [Vibrio spartinae]|nr:Tyrocidine synthase III [Vibrio spartinae]
MAVLTSIWQNALGVTDIHPDDDFFDLGGHSLLAIEILDEIRLHWSVDLPLKAVFEATSIALLTGVVQECLSAETGDV